MTRFSNLEKFFLLLTILGGSLILFFPVQNLLVALLGLIVFAFLFINPKICFYLMLILSTYTPAFATESQQMPFNQTDILITICFVSIVCRILSKRREIDVSTKIDKWFVLLLVFYFFSGVTSISHRGYQGFLKFGETTAVFYLTIHFLRTKEIKLAELVNVMLAVGVFQSFYGLLQSVTGSFGANFQDNRGYLGYLGIGSSLVWHGRGTFPHFNLFGPFLSTLFLFYLPINYFITKNKKRGNIILLILFFGVIISYSRGSLMSLIVGFAFFMFQIQKDKIKFLWRMSPFAFMIAGVVAFLKNSSYVSTLAPRNDMWALASNAITSSPKSLFFGSGLYSYRDAVWPYLPANISSESYNNYLAHNFILYYAVETGVLGAAMIVMFLINNLVITYKNVKSNKKLLSIMGSSVSIIILAFFVEGMFDMAFNNFVTQVWFYLILGIMCAYMSNKKVWSTV